MQNVIYQQINNTKLLMTNLCPFSHTKALESDSVLTEHLCSYW